MYFSCEPTVQMPVFEMGSEQVKYVGNGIRN